MSVVEVGAAVVIVGYVIGRQVRGEALRGRRVVLLPVVLTVVGFGRLGDHGRHVAPADIALLVIGGLLALGIGAGQGSMMRLESRDGGLWGRMPALGLWLWGGLIVSRVVLMLVAAGVHAHVAASSAPVLMLLGLNRLGQAGVIAMRATALGIPFAAEKDGRPFLADRRRRG
ncbi:hypothetical protein ABZ901_07820 [Actinacidiphila alni]|uniref:hypothetical protein n=1 Tax=Actinacidiphila alni TaxID=380248 RepID=UPI00340EFD04